jgi:hypothetical protein
VQVHHDEGVANRIDPELCADAREGIGEASPVAGKKRPSCALSFRLKLNAQKCRKKQMIFCKPLRPS